MCICTEQWIRRTDMLSVTVVLWTREIRAQVYKSIQEYIQLHFTIEYAPLIICMSLLWLKLFRCVKTIETLF